LNSYGNEWLRLAKASFSKVLRGMAKAKCGDESQRRSLVLHGLVRRGAVSQGEGEAWRGIAEAEQGEAQLCDVRQWHCVAELSKAKAEDGSECCAKVTRGLDSQRHCKARICEAKAR